MRAGRLQRVGLAAAMAGVLLSGCSEDEPGEGSGNGPIMGNTTGASSSGGINVGATAGTSGGSTAGTTGGNTAGTSGGSTTGATTAGTSGGSTTGATTTGTSGGSTAGTSGGTTAGTSGGSTAGTSGGTTAGTSGGSTAGTSGGTTAGTSGGTTAGTTGSSTGGSSSTGGTDDDAGVPEPGMSPGCGKTTFPASGMYNIDVAGTSRMFIIKLPTGYDPKKPYKFVFAWHYLGGSAAAIARGHYGLEALSAGSTIFVAPEGLETTGGKGWANAGGQDVAFAKAMAEKFKNDYCIDTDRIFSVGFSYGAIMSNTVGCAMGDVFRAIAPMSGSGPRGTCTGPVAVWISHGDQDTMAGVTYTNGQASRDFWVKANHCTTPGTADANGCVAYQGCDTGNPVTWCSVAGVGHQQPRFGPAEIWKFFSQF